LPADKCAKCKLFGALGRFHMHEELCLARLDYLGDLAAHLWEHHVSAIGAVERVGERFVVNVLDTVRESIRQSKWLKQTLMLNGSSKGKVNLLVFLKEQFVVLVRLLFGRSTKSLKYQLIDSVFHVILNFLVLQRGEHIFNGHLDEVRTVSGEYEGARVGRVEVLIVAPVAENLPACILATLRDQRLEEVDEASLVEASFGVVAEKAQHFVLELFRGHLLVQTTAHEILELFILDSIRDFNFVKSFANVFDGQLSQRRQLSVLLQKFSLLWGSVRRSLKTTATGSWQNYVFTSVKVHFKLSLSLRLEFLEVDQLVGGVFLTLCLSLVFLLNKNLLFNYCSVSPLLSSVLEKVVTKKCL